MGRQHCGAGQLAENSERAVKDVNPETADRSRKFIVELAEWEQTLHDRQTLALIPRLLAELRILKAVILAWSEPFRHWINTSAVSGTDKPRHIKWTHLSPFLVSKLLQKRLQEC